MVVFRDKRCNNRWRFSFSQDGIKKQGTCFGCFTKSDAEQYERDVRTKLSLYIRGHIKEEKTKISLGQACKLYLNHSETHNRSYKTDKSRVNKILKVFKSSTLINNIQPLQIEEFLYDLLETHKPATANRYRACFSGIFRVAVNNNYIDYNPVKVVAKFKEDNYVIRYLNNIEEKKLFQHLPDYLKPIVICALCTGMRCGEILNLKWTNIDFNLMVIDLTVTKNNSPRRIPISNRLCKVFKALYKENTNKNEFVFVNKNTNDRYKDIYQGFKNALSRANVENFRFHDLRHTAATRMVANNMDLIVVKEILGHKTIQTTMRYAHPLEELKIKAIDILDKSMHKN